MIYTILIVSSSFLVGKIIANKYIIRDLFFKEIKAFVCYIKNNICFSQNKIQNIIEEYLKTTDKKFLNHIELIKKVLCCEVEDREIKYSKLFWFLNSEEKSSMLKFLLNFGGSNNIVEVEKLTEFIKYLEGKSQEAEKQRVKNAPLTYKISFAIGVMFSMIIM